jgi:hypothetical protein
MEKILEAKNIFELFKQKRTNMSKNRVNASDSKNRFLRKGLLLIIEV